MAIHTVSPHDRTYVTSADRCRITFTVILMRDHARYAELEEALPAELRRQDGYGIALLQSEEHFVTYVGPPEHMREYQAAAAQGPATFDHTLGTAVAFWPSGPAWRQIVPDTTWNKGGTGIITEFPHRGGKVVVYEYVDSHEGEQVSMVAFHCDRCHTNHHDFSTENHGPNDRRWIGSRARAHMRPNAHDCRPVDPRIAEVVTQAGNEMYRANRPVITRESRCATGGPCSQIRHLRGAAAAQQSA